MTVTERYKEAVIKFRHATFLHNRMNSMKDAIKSYNRKIETETNETKLKSHRNMLARSENLYIQYEQELSKYLDEIQR